MERSTFLRIVGASLAISPISYLTNCSTADIVPSYLKGYEKEFTNNPRSAALEWFRDAKFGLFIHYGLYSLLGRGEWVQYHDRIPVAEYAKLKERFTADRFDANAIAVLVQEAGMKYMVITSKHHEGFCLWDSEYTNFDVASTPFAGRDILAELRAACK